MIENSDYIQGMLNEINSKIIALQNNFNQDGKTHYTYMLEKLRSAKWDLDILIDIAEEKVN